MNNLMYMKSVIEIFFMMLKLCELLIKFIYLLLYLLFNNLFILFLKIIVKYIFKLNCLVKDFCFCCSCDCNWLSVVDFLEVGLVI